MQGFVAHLAVGMIAVPFISSCAAFMLGGRRCAKVLGTATAFLLVVLSLVLAAGILESGAFRYTLGGWGSPLGIDLRVDGVSVTMLVLTAVVGTCVSLYAAHYFHSPDSLSENLFWPLWLFLLGGLNALFLSSDVFNIYITLEITTLAAIVLIIISGSVQAVSSALRYLFLSIVGSLNYLMGVALLYSTYGTLDIVGLQGAMRADLTSAVAVGLITVGLLVKTALFPMHFWLPPAHANAPAPVSAILSGLVIMGPFYLLVRFWLETFVEVVVPAMGQGLGVLGSLAIFYGAFHAFRQERLKMLVAYSTVAQIGYMFLIFPLMTLDTMVEKFAWSGGIYFAVAHACAKASAFMVAGSIIYVCGTDQIHNLKGLAYRLPVTVFTFGMAGLSLMGLPPSGGFIGKWLLLKAAMLSGQWWYALIMILGSLLTAGYIFRVLEITLQAPEKGDTFEKRVPWGMELAALVLALVAILLGFVAHIPLDLLKINSPVFTSPAELIR